MKHILILLTGALFVALVVMLLWLAFSDWETVFTLFIATPVAVAVVLIVWGIGGAIWQAFGWRWRE